MEEQTKVFRQVIETLENLSIPYMITGGFAVSFWGRPRATLDIDIVVEIKPQDIPVLVRAFEKDFYIDTGMIREAITGSKFFNIIHQKTQVKTDFHLLKDDPYSHLRFNKRLRVTILDSEASIVTPEDLILIKLLWYEESESSRHLEDAESVITIQGDKLNKTYLKEWAERLSTIQFLEDLLEK